MTTKYNVIRIFPAILGMLLIFLAYTAYGKSDDPSIFHTVIITFFGILALIGAIAWKHTGFVLQNTLLILVNTLFFILAIEAISYLWLTFTTDDEHIRQTNMPYYRGQDWAVEYWKTYNTDSVYSPYVIWRRPAQSSSTINVDDSQRRVTPGANCTEDALTIFAFGGSTMWGTGAPDWYTIPAYMQKTIEQQHNGPVCVVNYGETAFVSTQSVIQLMLALKYGHRPDIVVFYDGINDTYAAYQSNHAGLHQNMVQVSQRFNTKMGLVGAPVPQTLLLLEKWIDLGNTEHEDDTAGTTTGHQQLSRYESLSSAVVDDYLGNYELVRSLSENYGFDFYFFWQPVLLTSDKPLTSQEVNIIKGRKELQEIFKLTYEKIAAVEGYDQLYDISNALDHIDEWLYSDFMHITPVGNEAVAQRIVDIIMTE